MYQRATRKRTGVLVGALVVVAVAGFGVGHATAGHRASAAGYSGSPSTPTRTVCAVDAHTPQGAATAAAAGLYALSLVNLGDPNGPGRPAQIEAVLERYVVPEQRAGERAYLTQHPASITGLVTAPMLWQVITPGADQTTVRLLTADSALDAAGQPKAATTVLDVTLRWDVPASSWRLVPPFPADPDPAARAQLAAGGQSFCLAARGP